MGCVLRVLAAVLYLTNRFLKEENRKTKDAFAKSMEEKAKHMEGNRKLKDVFAKNMEGKAIHMEGNAKHMEGNPKQRDVFPIYMEGKAKHMDVNRKHKDVDARQNSASHVELQGMVVCRQKNCGHWFNRQNIQDGRPNNHQSIHPIIQLPGLA